LEITEVEVGMVRKDNDGNRNPAREWYGKGWSTLG